MTSISVTPIARSVPFDNTTNGFTSTEVQSAIEEAKNASGISRYCIVFGFDGTASTGRWLEAITNTPSDTSPIVIPTTSTLKELSIRVAANATTTASIYKNGIVTVIATISLAGTKSARVTGLNISLAAGDTLGVKITAGSGSKPVLGVYIKNEVI